MTRLSLLSPSQSRSARIGFRASASFALAWLIGTPASAQSLADPAVRAGAATVGGLGTNSVVVTQTTGKAIIDWRNFSVDAGSSVTFAQPDAASITLNRITGADATRIDGSMSANGQVWVLNPNGVLIGTGGRVSVGGLVATTHGISDGDFLAGNYRFDGAGAAGEVVNRGMIVADGGYAVLAGNRVANAGLVQARLGQVVMAAGGGFALDVSGDKLLSFAVTKPVDIVAGGASLVDNTGVLSAKGGAVLMTARAAADVVGNVINTTGLLDASAARMEGGTIVLDGGAAGLVLAGGVLDASGKGAGQRGGTVGVFGDSVVVGAGALVDASGTQGGGTINVGGGWQGVSVAGHASAIRTGVAAGAVLDASALVTGDGGEITVWSDVTNAASQTLAFGTLLARGGATGGDGGRVETSGHYLDTTGVTGSAASVSGKAGTWLFDPYNVEIVAAGGNSPAIVNPGFESGLTGWSAIAGSTTATQVVTAATSHSGAVFTSQVSPGGNFALASGGNEGASNGIEQSFSATAGQYFDLYALFLGQDYTPFNDSGTVQLVRPDGSVQSLYSQAISSGNDYLTVPWQQQRVTLTQTGTYTLRGYSSNVGDGGLSSQLGFELALGVSSVNGGFAATGFGQTWTPSGSSKIDVAQITGFLNAGTNVQITTTGAGTEAGNITVSAAIAKTAGTAATLQLDATNAILVNQAIGSSSSALNVTLNAGAGGIKLANTVDTNGGTLTLNTTGATTQTAALTTATLALSGIGGTHTLTNAGNHFAALTGSTGSAALADAGAVTVGGLASSGALSLAATGAITLGGIDNFAGTTTISTPVGITLASGTQIATGGLLSLQAGTDFVNNAGASAIATTGAGRWLIYSQAPSSDTFGGLVSGNTALWGATPGSTPPSAAPAGNRYLFAFAPTLTVTPVATHKTYGDTLNPASVGYTTSGLVNAATYGNVFAQDQLSGAPGLNGGYGGFAPTSYTGTYTLQSTKGTLSTSPGYLYAFGQATLTIDPRQLILAAVSETRVYDRTTSSTLTPTATGLVNGDTITSLTQAFDSANAGNRSLVVDNSYVISTTGGQTGSFNYAITRQSAAGTITPKSLTGSLVGAISKVYDGTTAATLAAGNYKLTGVIDGDTVGVATTTGSYDTKNVGAGKMVTVSGVKLNGAAAANYSIAGNVSGAIGTITAKVLNASLTGSVTRVYDGTTTASLAPGNYALGGTIAGDDVALNNPTTGSFADRNVGSSKQVSVTGLALTGSDAGNYTVNASVSAGIGTITARALNASLTGSVTRLYDGTTAATLASGNYALGGTIAGDDVALNNPTTGNFADRNVGSAKQVSVTGLALTGGDAGNYTVNASASAAIGTITAKVLTASLTGSVTRIYDGTTTASLASGNYALGGAIAGDNVALNNPTTGSFADRNVGSSKQVSVTGLALTGSDAGNYTVNASASAAIGTITARALNASLTGSVTRIYDGTTTASLAAGNYALGGTIAGDDVALNNPTAGHFADRNVGSAKQVSVNGLALTGGDAGNYTVNASANAAIGTITARALNASLTGSVSRIYDGTTTVSLASGNYALGGTIAGDDVALNNPTTGSFTDRNVGTAKQVSVTGLALTGGDAGNYTVNASANAAIGTITAKVLNASLTGSVTRVYDGTTTASLAAGNYALGGTIAGDSVALNNPTTGSFIDRNVGTAKQVSVTGLALTGGDAGNYTVNASANAAIGTITARALNASLTGSVTRIYDGTTAATLAASNYALGGNIAGDDVALNNPTLGNFADRNVGTAKQVSVTGLALTGGDAGNYTVNASANAAIGTITARALNASLTGSVTRVYDGTTTALLAPGNYALGGTIAGDDVALNNPTLGSFADRNVGIAKQVSVTGLALTGGDAGNYTVNASANAAIGTITAKVLTASLTGSVTRVYDGTTTASLASGNYALGGTIAGDSVALNNPTTGSFIDRNVGTAKQVSVTGLALTGGDAGNYTVNASANAAIGTITAKALTASLTGSVSRIYDGTNAASLGANNYALADIIAGDNVALNNPTAGSFVDRNVGAAKQVSVTGLALTGGDAANYTVNASAGAAIGTISAKALTASLTGSVTRTYDGTTAATLVVSNYALADTIAGDKVALNNPTAGSFADRNVGITKQVSVTGLALTGGDAGNYTVNASANAAIGTITAKALAASLTGTVAKSYDGSTAATLVPGNVLVSGFVGGEGGGVAATTGQFASATAGTDLLVSTTLAATDFTADNGTALSNYVLPLGPVSGRIGTITPQVAVTIIAQPILPPVAAPVASPVTAPVAAAASAVAILPPSSAVPSAGATSATPDASPDATSSAPAPVVTAFVATPVAASPPSPVAAAKPATPADAADAGDPILASVEPASGDKPASHADRQGSVTVPIAGGLLGEQRPLPPHSDDVPGVDQAFSGSGSTF